MNKSKERGFVNGDAVVATEGDLKVTGVVHEIYDDVVEVEYRDEFGLMDTMEFHESNVESVL